MTITWKDRIKVASATTGTGTLTLGAVATGYRTFASGDNSKLFAYVIEDGTAWETGYGTYTHSGTTFARTTRTDSSTGSAISCTGAEYLYVDLIADYLTAAVCTMRLSANQTSVASGVVTKCVLNQVDIDSGGMGNTGAGRIDILSPGLYRVFGAPIFDGLSAPAVRVFTAFKLTGATLPIEPETSASAGCFASPFGSVLTLAVAGDYVELYGFHNQGSTGAFYGAASGSATALTVEKVMSW